jgi:hypothetical protein
MDQTSVQQAGQRAGPQKGRGCHQEAPERTQQRGPVGGARSTARTIQVSRGRRRLRSGSRGAQQAVWVGRGRLTLCGQRHGLPRRHIAQDRLAAGRRGAAAAGVVALHMGQRRIGIIQLDVAALVVVSRFAPVQQRMRRIAIHRRCQARLRRRPSLPAKADEQGDQGQEARHGQIIRGAV